MLLNFLESGCCDNFFNTVACIKWLTLLLLSRLLTQQNHLKIPALHWCKLIKCSPLITSPSLSKSFRVRNFLRAAATPTTSCLLNAVRSSLRAINSGLSCSWPSGICASFCLNLVSEGSKFVFSLIIEGCHISKRLRNSIVSGELYGSFSTISFFSRNNFTDQILKIYHTRQQEWWRCLWKPEISTVYLNSEVGSTDMHMSQAITHFSP